MNITKLTAIITGIILITGIAVPLDAFADVISPKKQLELNIVKSKVSCKQGFFKVIKDSDDTPACVKLASVEKLVEKGWAKPVDTKLITEAKQATRTALGEIKNTLTVRQVGDSGRLDTTPLTNGYNFIFEVYFGSTILIKISKTRNSNIIPWGLVSPNYCA